MSRSPRLATGFVIGAAEDRRRPPLAGRVDESAERGLDAPLGVTG